VRRSANISASRANGALILRKPFQLSVGEATRLLGDPTDGLDRIVREQQRQCEIIRHLFGTHIVKERKAFALGRVQSKPDFLSGAKEDRQRALGESR
jgi:hypothetical protein